MERASYEQGLQLDRDWLALKSKLDKDGAQRLIQHFDLIKGYATGKLDLCRLQERFGAYHSVPKLKCCWSLESLIEQANLDGVDERITQERFLTDPVFGPNRIGIGEYNLGLHYSDKRIHHSEAGKTRRILMWIEAHGCFPGTIGELLVFVGKYSLEQVIKELELRDVYDSPCLPSAVAALGSQWKDENGTICVPFVSTKNGKQSLRLWDGYYRWPYENFLFLFAIE